MLKDLLAEVFSAFVGSVEAEEVVVSSGTQEVVDEGAPVTAETSGVTHNTLGIKSDDVFHGDKVSANEWKNQIYLSFPECSLTSRIEKT
jgi:hypothetical protein